MAPLAPPAACVDASTAYEQPLLERVLRARGWAVPASAAAASLAASGGAPLLQLRSARDVDWGPVLSGRCAASALAVRTALTRKAELARALARDAAARRRTPATGHVEPEANSPETYVIDEDDDTSESDGDGDFADGDNSQGSRLDTIGRAWAAARGRGGVWVLKPSEANRGHAISFLRADEGVRAQAPPNNGERHLRSLIARGGGLGTPWVLQRRVERPLLYRRRKTHLRIHFVLCGDARLLVHRNAALVLPAAREYDASALADKLVHVTNHCVQKNAAKQEAQAPGEGVRAKNYALQDFLQYVLEEGDANARACVECAGGAQLACESILRSCGASLASAVRGSPKYGLLFAPGTFELFGADFIVDDTLRPWLLEINADPSMSLFEEERKEMCEEMWANVVDIAVPEALRALDLDAEVAAGVAHLTTDAEMCDTTDDVWIEAWHREATSTASAARKRARALLQCAAALLATSRENVRMGGGRTDGADFGSSNRWRVSWSESERGSRIAANAICTRPGWSIDARGQRGGAAHVQWVSHSEVAWDRVIDGRATAAHFFARSALIGAHAPAPSAASSALSASGVSATRILPVPLLLMGTLDVAAHAAWCTSATKSVDSRVISLCVERALCAVRHVVAQQQDGGRTDSSVSGARKSFLPMPGTFELVVALVDSNSGHWNLEAFDTSKACWADGDEVIDGGTAKMASMSNDAMTCVLEDAGHAVAAAIESGAPRGPLSLGLQRGLSGEVLTPKGFHSAIHVPWQSQK